MEGDCSKYGTCVHFHEGHEGMERVAKACQAEACLLLMSDPYWKVTWDRNIPPSPSRALRQPALLPR